MTDYLPPSQEALPCNNNFFDAKLTWGGLVVRVLDLGKRICIVFLA
jgi:hypothetical protein